MPLDEAVLLVAAHAHDVDVEAGLRELDALAAGVPSGGPDVLAHHLFQQLGFRGNAHDYGDPANSYLDVVLERRLGLPITLSILMIEVGRRRGQALHGVGMPGHFIVGAEDRWFDPFHGGVELDEAAVAATFARANPGVGFRVDFLAPSGTRAIVQRVLANLHASLLARDPASAVWVIRLRLLVPGLTPSARAGLAGALGELGAFAEAARELDAVRDELPSDAAARAASAATSLRARAN